MEKFKEELINAIVEVSMDTGITVKECIGTAMEMLEKENKPKKEKKKENYIDGVLNQMFGGW